MFDSMPHSIAYGMLYVECKGIPHGHVVYFLAIVFFLTMWYAFSKPQKTSI